MTKPPDRFLISDKAALPIGGAAFLFIVEKAGRRRFWGSTAERIAVMRARASAGLVAVALACLASPSFARDQSLASDIKARVDEQRGWVQYDPRGDGRPYAGAAMVSALTKKRGGRSRRQPSASVLRDDICVAGNPNCVMRY
jgi:hypothetical protein